jgi:hypothetical protein
MNQVRLKLTIPGLRGNLPNSQNFKVIIRHYSQKAFQRYSINFSGEKSKKYLALSAISVTSMIYIESLIKSRALPSISLNHIDTIIMWNANKKCLHVIMELIFPQCFYRILFIIHPEFHNVYHFITLKQ